MYHVASLNGSKKMNPASCNSAACAMGWAPVSFPKLLKYKAYTPHHDDLIVVLKSSRRKNITDYEAMQVIFGMTDYESEMLFNAGRDKYRTPKQVANGLRHYANTGLLPREVFYTKRDYQRWLHDVDHVDE